CLQGYNTPFTF
nr:immunoglobulin light chain junction region [Macaca mulatta]MOW41031.1 immunoglobulin light chain junction region [Macaca mulatta]MOW41764.1 immunoglobulin light chain junction region [Macaca mulatta]MOW42269.1 immunoglobulin light chain junction region [Macaca mulatta]MOW43258.1 immunoglobulin light chain junction region [Macaca mulatta]